MLRITVPLLLCACAFPERPAGVACEERIYAQPGQDEADSGAVYIGCDPPDGWVLTQPDPETGDTHDTGEASTSP